MLFRYVKKTRRLLRPETAALRRYFLIEDTRRGPPHLVRQPNGAEQAMSLDPFRATLTVKNLLTKFVQNRRGPAPPGAACEALVDVGRKCWVVVELIDDPLLLLVGVNQVVEIVADTGAPARRNLRLNEVIERFGKLNLNLDHTPLPW